MCIHVLMHVALIAELAYVHLLGLITAVTINYVTP
jgi:hypothetical protein